uniref:Na(+)/H(+) exchange regulatory cofactor NHE-RF2-like n=1 Tax=Styela clava TaxID=7725 RepID=UPI00193ACE0A|nr:Na(+)/H(+) exchange regulatory cofactor NHE-RF2-like [Styela clava]
MFSQIKRKTQQDTTEPINGGKSFRYGRQRLCIIKARSGHFSSKFGIGIAIPTDEDSLIHKIGFVQRGSPASMSGLRLNDVILKINGQDSNEFTHDDLVNYFREYNQEEIRLIVVQPVQGDVEPMA